MKDFQLRDGRDYDKCFDIIQLIVNKKGREVIEFMDEIFYPEGNNFYTQIFPIRQIINEKLRRKRRRPL